jgi:hypothetical protein
MTALIDVPHGSPPWWSSHVDLQLELGISRSSASGSTVAAWDRSLWDSGSGAVWSGLEPEWFALSDCRILDLSIERGRERWLDRYGSSSASVTVEDPDGLLSWQPDEDLLVARVGRSLRIRAQLVETGEDLTLWRGWIESISAGFDPGAVPTVQLTAQDGFAQVAHVDMPEQAPVGGGESSAERIERLLDLADWPAEWRDIEPGRITVQATNLARSIADDLGITADSEGGALYSDRTDRMVFRNRDWLRTDPRAIAVQASIGTAPGDYCATGYETAREGSEIVNDVQVSRAGGTVQRFTDEASIGLYLRRTFQRTDYVCETDEQIDLLGRRILGTRSSDQLRLPAITLRPLDNAAEWRFCCEVDYGWRIAVAWDAEQVARAEGGWTREVIVQGIDYKIDPGGWEITLKVDDAKQSAADVWDGVAGWDVAEWSVAE